MSVSEHMSIEKIASRTHYNALEQLLQSVYAALERYSNVHRGSGHYSVTSTHLFEKAREIVLEYLGLDKEKYVVIFCSLLRAEKLRSMLSDEDYKILSSREAGLPVGMYAIAARKRSLPPGRPLQTGGGTARLISPTWAIWDDLPGKFEAGTPAVINAVAFARSLQIRRKSGPDVFKNYHDNLSAYEILYKSTDSEVINLLSDLREKIIGRNKPVPAGESLTNFVNLDNAASTPAIAPAWDAYRQALNQPDETLQDIVKEVKSILAGFLGFQPEDFEVIFTSNTTEALNIAADNLIWASTDKGENVILNTLLEHNSNELPWRYLAGFTHIMLNIDDNGFIDLDELDRLLCSYNLDHSHGNKRIKLFSITGASNVLGVYNDLEAISKTVHKYGAMLLVDAAQLIAHRKINISLLGIDFLVFSAHKAYAPFGSGALIARKELIRLPADELDLARRSGEENVAGIAALGKALLLLQKTGLDVISHEEHALTASLLLKMAEIPGLKIYGINDPYSREFSNKGGVIVFSMKGFSPHALASALANNGIGVRYGCHCSHLLIKRMLHVPPWATHIQGVLVRVFPRINLPGLVRVSIGIGNDESDIERLIRALQNIGGKISGLKKEQMNIFIDDVIRKVYPPE